MIKWNEKRITFQSERCVNWCLKESPVPYAVPEAEALEENLIARFSNAQAKEGEDTQARRLAQEAKVPTKWTTGDTEKDLYASGRVEDDDIQVRQLTQEAKL